MVTSTTLNRTDRALRFLIADDHFIVRRGLKEVLAERFNPVDFGEACNGNDAIEAVWKESWDMVLLDISMPGRGGLEALREIKTSKPKLPVIILSMLPEEQFGVRVLKLGASGYLRKDSAGSDLVEAVETAMRGQQYIPPSLARALAAHLIDTNGGNAPHKALSDREFQVLCLLGSGLTVKEIAAKLSLSAKTISTYRVRTLEKMGMRNNAQVVQYVIKNHLATEE